MEEERIDEITGKEEFTQLQVSTNRTKGIHRGASVQARYLIRRLLLGDLSVKYCNISFAHMPFALAALLPLNKQSSLL